MNSKLRLEIFDDSNINDVQLKAIYDLNQANYPEVGFLDSNDHLTRLIKFSSYNLIVFKELEIVGFIICMSCLLYTSPSPRDKRQSRMPSSA